MKHEKYVNEVLSSLDVSREDKKSIENLLRRDMILGEENDPYFDPLLEWGAPATAKDRYLSQLSNQSEEHHPYRGYEYKSTKMIFGLPLIHINTSRSRGIYVAKGIIAIGDVSVGVVSIGGLSLGLFSIGGLSIGAVALGGIALGGLALGGLAIGLISIGGLALGFFKAIGGLGIVFGK